MGQQELPESRRQDRSGTPDDAILATIANRADDVAALCRRHGVTQLDLFGSATGGNFDRHASDLDFLVAFNQRAKLKAYDNYFGLREGLEQLFDRPVDLLTVEQIKNPYLQAAIEASRRPIYVE